MKIDGKKLKKARKLIGLTQGELADKIHSQRQYINYYENNKQEPSEETMRRIVKILNKPIIKGGFVKTLLEKYTVNHFLKK